MIHAEDLDIRAKVRLCEGQGTYMSLHPSRGGWIVLAQMADAKR